jgi:phospholipid/cholesterol/gamma-HCH transport system permease protein
VNTANPDRVPLGRKLLRQLREWGGIVHFAAMALVIALSPSTYRGDRRAQIARNIYLTTWQVLPWFTVLCALLCLVLIRIVVVTARIYGLSQYALELVVRVLVLELIPLSAALFVVLRTGMAAPWQPPTPEAAEQPALTKAEHGLQLVPSVIATAFSVVTLAAVSSVVALLLAYLVVYGFSPWGFNEYTRMVGRVFDGPVALSFSLKTLLFALAVAVVPTASNLYAPPQPVRGAIAVSAGTVRLFLVLVLIEGSSLAVKYIG